MGDANDGGRESQLNWTFVLISSSHLFAILLYIVKNFQGWACLCWRMRLLRVSGLRSDRVDVNAETLWFRLSCQRWIQKRKLSSCVSKMYVTNYWVWIESSLSVSSGATGFAEGCIRPWVSTFMAGRMMVNTSYIHAYEMDGWMDWSINQSSKQSVKSMNWFNSTGIVMLTCCPESTERYSKWEWEIERVC